MISKRIDIKRVKTEAPGDLEEIAAKLLQSARKLPHGPDRQNILKEIRKFRVRIAALKAKMKGSPQPPWTTEEERAPCAHLEWEQGREYRQSTKPGHFDGASQGQHNGAILVRDLTAHRTLGLRLHLGEQPEVAIVTVTHALAAQIFYLEAEAHVVDIRPINTVLASHADGIEDTPAGKAWADRHANWARQLPRNVADLWVFVVELDHDSRMALFAHCVALTVNAAKLPWERNQRGS